MDNEERLWCLTAEDVYEVAKSLNVEITDRDLERIADMFSDNIDWWDTLVVAIKEVKRNGL